MLPCRSVRSTSKLVWIAMSLGFGTSALALAAPGDCTQIDAKAAGSLLGVPARATANQGHSKLPPDNMDFLSCLYLEMTPSPTARMLTYQIYTPIPKDLANVYASLASGNIARKQIFSPNVGDQSSGWFRSGLTDNKFEGYVAMQSGATIFVIKVGGMPSSEAAKNALVGAGKILAKP
jgi:hypothetical protein